MRPGNVQVKLQRLPVPTGPPAGCQRQPGVQVGPRGPVAPGSNLSQAS